MQYIKEFNKIIHSEHPFIVLMNDIGMGLSALWHYPIFKVDQKPIAVANIVIGCFLLILGLKFARSCSLLIRQEISRKIKVDNHTANFLENLFYYLFILIISFFVLEVSNVPLTALTVVGTTLALGVGLGSQNIVNNFISGLIIMIEKPIKLGDIVEVKGVIGKVNYIGARSVSIQTDNNINMLVPNSNILQDNIINWTLNDPTLKLSLPIKVAYNGSIEKIDQVLYQILNQDDNVLKEPPPKVLLLKISEKSLTFEMEFWINLNNQTNKKEIIDKLNRLMDPIFRENKIKILRIKKT